MKAYWEYLCDEGHTWTVMRDIDAVENPGDVSCSLGHESVTLHKAVIPDMVQVAIRPAARVTNGVSGQITRSYDYYLVVMDLHNNVERMSRRTFTWNEAILAMERFRLRADLPGTVSARTAWMLMDDVDSSENVG